MYCLSASLPLVLKPSSLPFLYLSPVFCIGFQYIHHLYFSFKFSMYPKFIFAFYARVFQPFERFEAYFLHFYLTPSLVLFSPSTVQISQMYHG